MQGSKEGRMNLEIRGCKDARIQASTHKHEDMKMLECEDISKCTGTYEYKGVRMQGCKQVKYIKHVGYF